MDYPVLGHYDPTVEATDHGSGEEEQELLCKCPFCIVVCSRARSFHLLRIRGARRRRLSFGGCRKKEKRCRNFSGLALYSTRDFPRIVCFPLRDIRLLSNARVKYRIVGSDTHQLISAVPTLCEVFVEQFLLSRLYWTAKQTIKFYIVLIVEWIILIMGMHVYVPILQID